jgi:hypothetical protein
VHCLGAGGQCRLDDPIDPQIALGGRRGPDADRPVGGTDMPGRRVRVAVDCHRLHAQLMAGTDQPNGDLAAVGDQDAVERTVGRGHWVPCPIRVFA